MIAVTITAQIIQLCTFIYALYLGKHTGLVSSKFAMIPVAAILLMGSMRAIPLIYYFLGKPYSVSPVVEILGLFLSIFIVFGVVGLGRVFAEQKRSKAQIATLLEEKELLLREVHHRVKNNLTTIVALLNLQSRDIPEPSAKEALAEAVDRVKAMAVLYEKMYKTNNFGTISLSSYLSSLVDEIVANGHRSTSVRVEKHLPDIQVDATKLYYIGIILNEVITNSLKYAFQDRSEGVIDVSVTRTGDFITLKVTDDGVGLPPDGDAGDGFGMTLIAALVTQLGGKKRVEGNNGLSISFDLPL